MIGRFFSAPAFSFTFGAAYAATLYFDCPLFRYYPLVQRFSWKALADPLFGPGMSWFGWIATAAIVAAIVTPLIPKRMGDRIPAGMFWIVMAAMLAAAGYREREWFVSAI